MPCFNAVCEVTERSLAIESVSFSAQYDKQRSPALLILACKGVVMLVAAAFVNKYLFTSDLVHLQAESQLEV